MILLALLALAPVAVLTAHAGVNALLLRRPGSSTPCVDTSVSVLLPVRDEAHRVRPCLEALLGQQGIAALEIVVVDDGSTDGTGELVHRLSGDDRRVRLVRGTAPPPGWLGKPHACHQAAAHATGSVLVFVDADVVLAPTAVAAAVALLRDFDLASPYPRVVGAGRLLQPLLQWSWLTFLPLRAMERSHRASLAAAGGQFLAVRRGAYDRAGGHAVVRDRVLEDIELARAIKRTGGRITLADGSTLASARMYGSWSEVVDGYTKSLWAAVRPPWVAAVVATVLLVLYVVPPAAAVIAAAQGAWSWAGVGCAGYLLGVAGRIISGRATGARIWPDALAHPASIAVLTWLLVRSHLHHRRGDLTWKGRSLGT